MSMPNFTAEESLCTTSEHYRPAAIRTNICKQVVAPQLSRKIKCAAALSAAAVACGVA
jgi:hypothetical protein